MAATQNEVTNHRITLHPAMLPLHSFNNPQQTVR